VTAPAEKKAKPKAPELPVPWDQLRFSPRLRSKAVQAWKMQAIEERKAEGDDASYDDDMSDNEIAWIIEENRQVSAPFNLRRANRNVNALMTMLGTCSNEVVWLYDVVMLTVRGLIIAGDDEPEMSADEA